jgi:hypothetical protein
VITLEKKGIVLSCLWEVEKEIDDASVLLLRRYLGRRGQTNLKKTFDAEYRSDTPVFYFR